QTLNSHQVIAEVDALRRLEFGFQPVDERLVEVVAAEAVVAAGRFHFENAIGYLKNADVEGAAAQVINQNGRVFAGFVETVGKRACRRLVDDTHHFQSGNLSGITGRLAHGVVEISRDGDNSLGNRLADVSLGVGT